MLRRRVKDVLKRRLPGLVRLRDAIRDLRAEPAASAPVSPFATAASAPEPAQAEASRPSMDFDAVQALLDDMVRPALQADGGDIELVKVEGDDVYVNLVGACHSCPSATVTMRMGVQRLLQDEFPTMGRLVEVGGAPFA